MEKPLKLKVACDCKDGNGESSCCSKDKKCRRPINIIFRVICGLIFITAATLVLLNIFGAITLTVNIGILVAILTLGIVAIYSAFHFFWGGLFFLSAAIVTIMNANGLVFDLDGQAIGNLYIAAALLTVAFHVIFRKRIFPHSRDADANFGATVKYFEDELDTATLDCNFGSVKAYFENAKPKNGEATIKLDCNFGGIELYIPKTWRVIDKTHSSFAGVEEKNHPAPTKDSPTLTLTGEINFGGLTIIYV
ncbi:hypothetical protein FWF89_00405 [Candidatus Saccharibacteria bacterium]|nr:hypothetical protein [Candidatus Saccharibacteria bacterium]